MFNNKWLFLILPFLLISCSRNEATFETETFLDATIIAGSSILETHIYEQEVIFPFSGSLSAFNLETNDISKVLARAAVIYPVFGDNVDLDFIDIIIVRAVDPDDSNNTKEVFHLEPVPLGNKQEIELFPSLPDIKDFIRDDRLVLRVEFNYRLFPPRSFDLRTEMIFGAIEIE